MHSAALDIDGVYELVPDKIGDGRGFFSEVYSAKRLRDVGIEWTFVQDNQSWSRDAGTIRGLHFQIPPAAQGKLIRVVQGSILDVCVDIRFGSPTYGKHVSRVVSKSAWNQMLVPVGFAHGFCTLEPDTEVVYKVTAFYSPEHERGVLWNDPDLRIEWPGLAQRPTVAARDSAHPRLKDLPRYFEHAKP